MKYSTMKRLAGVRQVFKTFEQMGNTFLKIALCFIVLFGVLVWGFTLGRDFSPNQSTPSVEVSFASENPVMGNRTTLGAMQPGESCMLPESIFHEWPEDKDGDPEVPEDAILLVYKDTSEVTQDLFLPLDMPVICTAQAPILGRPYIHLVKGPGDKKSWFQIRGAENVNHYTLHSWDATPTERQRRMVEVDIR